VAEKLKAAVRSRRASSTDDDADERAAVGSGFAFSQVTLSG
jgi:hypothetical protein